VTYLNAKLCDVFEDGTSALVTRGLLNLTQRESREHPTPLEPGREYRVTLELEATSWIFEVGHRVRLDLAGADWPNAWPPPTPAEISIRRGDATLVLPVLEGPTPVAERPWFPPVDAKALGKASSDTDPEARKDIVWRIERDVLRSRTRTVIDHGGAPYEVLPGTRVREHYGGSLDVSIDDPGDATADGIGSFDITWGDVRVKTEARLALRSDAEAYHVHLELDASEGNELRWTRRWDRTIPRNLQ
jgi:hypothetical protein